MLPQGLLLAPAETSPVVTSQILATMVKLAIMAVCVPLEQPGNKTLFIFLLS